MPKECAARLPNSQRKGFADGGLQIEKGGCAVKVSRLLIYEGAAEDIEKQLSQSLPDGYRDGKVNILVVTLGTLPNSLEVRYEVEHLRRKEAVLEDFEDAVRRAENNRDNLQAVEIGQEVTKARKALRKALGLG